MKLTPSFKPAFLRRAVASLALISGGATLSTAAVSWNKVQIGGFISQGYLQTSGNNYPVDTKDGTTDFREMAVNASTTFGQHLRVGGQLFAQKFGKYGDDKVVIDWAVADYNFRQEIGVRVGRIKYPRSLQSEVLDADVLRPFIFLPQAMYDSRLRDFQASFDGAMAYGTISAGSSSFDYKIFYGDIPMKTDSGLADFFNNSSLFAKPGLNHLELDSVRGATLAWNTPIPGLRLAAYYSYLTNLVAKGPFAAIPSLTSQIDITKASFTAASAEYTQGAWTLNGEYMIESNDSVLTLPSFIAAPSKSTSGNRDYYVSVARRLNEKFELGTYYAHTHRSYPNPSVASWKEKRDDWTVSGRYDYNDHLLFKLEVHFINGAKDVFNVAEISNPPADLQESTTLFAAKATFSF